MQSQKRQMISVRLQGKPFNITVIPVYAATRNGEEAEVERFYEDLQDILEPTPKRDVLFIVGDWNAKVGSQETPGVTGFSNTTVQKHQFFGAQPSSQSNSHIHTCLLEKP